MRAPLEIPSAEGRFTSDPDGTEWYRIDDYDLLDPFLITVVAPDDQWIYASTSGALTAGRGSAERSLFPYETDDRLHRNGGTSGPATIIRSRERGVTWEPLAPWVPRGMVRRSVAKTTTGDRLRFEEHHPDLGLTFRATWATAGDLGLIRRCELQADPGGGPVAVELVDGLVDVLPAQVELTLQQTASTLVDAYRRSEIVSGPGFDTDPDRPLAIFSLEALISDGADPAEALTANAVWACGLDRPIVALSDRQLGRFRSGAALEAEHLVTGRKGAFLVSTGATIEPGAALRWTIGADVGLDHPTVDRLRRRVGETADLPAEIDIAVDEATTRLVDIVAAADGLQETASRSASVHHFANTLFNAMRGGVFLDDHRVDRADVERFVASRNRPAAARFAAVTGHLTTSDGVAIDGGAPDGDDGAVEIDHLRAAVAGDADLSRLVAEYLPLTFSRRHGDPSRPWNRFQIPAPEPDGSPARGYEGNWRDIFQNWEALTHSYPGYLESVIAKFLNASTLDGHNPYRITDRGIDWELPEPGSWGNFGYWGDHQIVYLHRLLAAAERFHPGLLEARLDERVYSYADVPYRIADYDDLVADPKRTLSFDEDRQRAVEHRVERLGADGRLVPSRAATDEPGRADDLGSAVHHATLAEKLLVPALAKLSNLVAGAGIWLNTQRPEWNDANNALVGNGVSTVTLFHLRDYLAFLDRLLERATGPVRIGEPVLTWVAEVEEVCRAHDPGIDTGPAGDEARRSLLDGLGRAFERYRHRIDDAGPGPQVAVEPSSLRRFLAGARPHLDHAAASARRPDGLFHSYWLLHLEPGRARLEPLYEMLEGQVAALGAADTDPRVALRLVDALLDSDLYRPDQGSFVLYPNRRPPAFGDKNRIPDELVTEPVRALHRAGSGLLVADGERPAADEPGRPGGPLRFAAGLRSGRELAAALDRLAGDDRLGPLVAAGRADIEEAYEAVFNHRAFTGRSQTMYRYEGLGSIYWHMVSKLLAALQDRTLAAVDPAPGAVGADEDLALALADRYRRVRAGLGFTKTAAEHGAFPTDPHSHTPAHTGAQQPGMTGQVKEGVLIRWAELGVTVDGGRVRFQPRLLDRDEFLAEPRPWAPLGPDGELGVGTLGSTYCGVPVVYRLGDEPASTSVTWSDGRVAHSAGPELDRDTSRALFARTGRIARIEVTVLADSLLTPKP